MEEDMARTLYFKVEFVTLRQTKPADYENESPKLAIGNVQTSTPKYKLHPDQAGDPGQPYASGFDYAEFKITKARFTKASDAEFRTQSLYDIEAVGGGTREAPYAPPISRPGPPWRAATAATT
jgi:hypothetical protein